MSTWLDAAERVVANGQYERVDGVLLDYTTASAMVSVHKALSDAAKAKFEAMPLVTAADITWKLVNR